LKAEIPGCIQFLDEGDFPSQPISELERKLSEALYNCDDAIIKLEAQLALLKDFARKVIISEPWGNGAEAFDIQDIAEKLGLIILTTATEEYVSEYTNFEVGDSIYKFSDILKEQE